ncbi:MAG: hypothetical protein RIC35_08910 [Marinoscillum sp.]
MKLTFLYLGSAEKVRGEFRFNASPSIPEETRTTSEFLKMEV